jgi:hypothetical protein
MVARSLGSASHDGSRDLAGPAAGSLLALGSPGQRNSPCAVWSFPPFPSSGLVPFPPCGFPQTRPGRCFGWVDPLANGGESGRADPSRVAGGIRNGNGASEGSKASKMQDARRHSRTDAIHAVGQGHWQVGAH